MTTEVIQYQTSGTCCGLMQVKITDGIIEDAEFYGGCNGNLKGIKSLIKGMKIDDVIEKLQGNSEIAAFGLCFPSLSEALKRAKGKLFPFGWYHILKAYRKYDTIDLMMVGSSPAWAQKGLSAIFHSQLAANSKQRNIQTCITNPQIDTNIAAVKVWESYDKEPFMRRRCWIAQL